MFRTATAVTAIFCFVCALLTAASAQPITTMKHALSILSETSLTVRSPAPPIPVASAEKGQAPDKKARQEPPRQGREQGEGMARP